MTVKEALRKVTEDAVTLIEGQQSIIDSLTNELVQCKADLEDTMDRANNLQSMIYDLEDDV